MKVSRPVADRLLSVIDDITPPSITRDERDPVDYTTVWRNDINRHPNGYAAFWPLSIGRYARLREPGVFFSEMSRRVKV